MGFLWTDSRIWPAGVIPVDLDALNVDAEMNVNMQAALLDWMHKTEITFVPWVGQKDHLTFKLDTSRDSSAAGGTGREGGAQVMILGFTGDWSHYAHEVSHTIGFIHEHQRPDRGDYVIVIPPTLGQSLPENYKIYEHQPSTNQFFGPYDWESVSHYRQDARLYPNTLHSPPRVGSWGGASEGDVNSVRAAYGFSEPAVGMLDRNGAVSRGPDRLDVVARWKDNGIHRVHWNGSWNDWQPVGREPSTAEAKRDHVGRTLTAPTIVSRTVDTMNVFIRGLYDDIYTSSYSGGSWTTWQNLEGGKALSAVTALSRSIDSIDVAVRGMNSGVYTTRFEQVGGWEKWSRVSNGVAASEVTMVAPADYQLNLFVLGLNGGIYTSRRTDGGSWTGWDRVGTGSAMFGTSVAAVSRSQGVIDLFVIGTNGGVYSAASHDGGKSWKRWFRVSDGLAAPGTTVTAVKGRNDSLDVFVVGEDMRIWTASWDAAGSVTWDDGWRPLGTHTVAHRSAISAVARNPETIDLFTVGSDGRTWTGGITGRSLVGWWPASTPA